ncbi:contact-dependent growth inhibition system immunity protein [Acuticoccus sp. MNP-M23]|uniref:contact-dependent growth inhibition system immunity protein n=1 Tax=Acuticoccus sp. MNP-M23 TaxID=3072793 RepID=UPI002814DB0F|nr:contact-dependent growth inhibition system immunity protein [Acuticoccus sp. MNP-M23]WMS43469.1 contact-dependent growth inhibition system immunity protein [Acuticoccus sp. MNP-M23]
MDNYKDFSEFIRGWFHQDFDLNGQTVEEIVGAYVQSSRSAERLALLDEIAAYRRAHSADIEDDFIERFSPEVDPIAFSGSVATFLYEIEDALRSSVQK